MPSPPSESDPASWLRALPPASGTGGHHEELGPLQLAWLGDAVWELHQRLRRCERPGRSDALHVAVVEDVRAEAQAAALDRLEPLLEDGERDWVRRGRNRAGRGPRRGNASTYARATGFETMVGWLFLRNPGRLAQLLDHLEQTDPDPLPDHR